MSQRKIIRDNYSAASNKKIKNNKLYNYDCNQIRKVNSKKRLRQEN